MTEFRFSRTLDRLGINYNTQGLIYFLCVNARRLPEQDKAVLNMCLEVAGEDYQALYKFLTDSSVYHVYIQMQYGLHSSFNSSASLSISRSRLYTTPIYRITPSMY